MKFNIFFTEKNHAVNLPHGHPGAFDTRREGGPDGFDSRIEAERYMAEMRAQAVAAGRGDYADGLHVEPADYVS